MIIQRIAINKNIQNIIKRAGDNPEFYHKINSRLPVLETIVATTAYSVSIATNKNIEKERKPSLQYQNIICGSAGIFLGSKIHKFIVKHQEPICFELEKLNIPKANNLITGVKIAVPLVIFSLLLRFIMPLIATPISTQIERYRLLKMGSK